VTLRQPIAAALAAVLLGATHAHVHARPAHHAPLTLYRAPAGTRPAGAPNPVIPFDAILPNGRTVAPVGDSAFVGAGAAGIALTADGKYAVVSNVDDRTDGATYPRDARIGDGYSLAVVNSATMHVASVFLEKRQSLARGVIVLRDPSDASRSLVFAAGGRDNAVHVFDLDASGVLVEEPDSIAMPGGSDARYADYGQAFPLAIAAAPDERTIYVTNALAGTVTAVDVATRKALTTVPVGYFPSAIVSAGGRVYVTNEGVGRYIVLPKPLSAPPFAVAHGDPQRTSTFYSLATGSSGDLDASAASDGHVLMDRIPDGVRSVGAAHPSAVVTSADGRYAFVCMTGVDRVAIVALGAAPRVIGGLSMQLFAGAPYGTQPDAIARSHDGKRLYVALAGMNAIAVLDSSKPTKLHRLGLIPTGWYPSGIAISPNGRYLYVTNAKGAGDWATLQRVDLKKIKLEPVTLSTLRYNRTATIAKSNALVPPLRSLRKSSAISHVVLVVDRAGRIDGAQSPNLNALAKTFASAVNLYADDPDPWTNEQFALGGLAVAYDRTFSAGDAPETYPRAGYLFNQLLRAGDTYRDYGGLLDVVGYRNGAYPLDVPALAALAANADTAYDPGSSAVTDVARAREFVRDASAREKLGKSPTFAFVRLASSDPADGDRALGTIVDYLTHSPQWGSTAVFVLTEGARDMQGRAGAVVVSPYARRGYEGHTHLSTASVLKTEEELLGLRPLSLNDLLASDMADFFTKVPNRAPWSNTVQP
jgi:YVTN family beta-propeller protein